MSGSVVQGEWTLGSCMRWFVYKSAFGVQDKGFRACKIMQKLLREGDAEFDRPPVIFMQ